ncbi:glycosyltransferase [Kutzneria viridogrisea]|uniref:Glycosyltransferase n=2 Tax=Kutzneria TaxID=43356 RepID=W5WFE2_9PSEU|nr:macrolide family glycosyltransferase [Kutzneria albida]AHH99918.1 glycosyltransferase [Kutzneria albida DSM 43870]MBA8925099.1 MGT family glycosyltransferase [Kutzneria viridogrisea]
MTETSTARQRVSGRHVLMWPFPGYGHVNPTLPVVRELVRRGHRVTFATTEKFAAAAEAAGAEVLRYASALAGRPLPEVYDADYLAREPLRAMLEAMATVPPVESHFAGRDLPDVILYDSSTYAAGRVLAAKWQRSAIQMYPTFATNEQFGLGDRIREQFAPDLDTHHPALIEFFIWMGELLTSHNLELSMEEFHAPCLDRNLVFLPRSFQMDNEKFDDRHEFVGPCLDEEPGDWTPPEGDDPLVVVSLGTENNRDLEFFKGCAAVFAGLPWQVVLTLGGLDPADLGELPPNVQAHRYLSHTDVLPHTKVFVSHAGMSSTMRGLHYGVAHVFVPQTPEQYFVGKRGTELGVGRLLTRDEATPEAVRDAVLAVAADESVWRRVAELRAETRAAGGAVLAADIVEAKL